MTRTTDGRAPRTDEDLLTAVRAQAPHAFQDLRDRHWTTTVAVARLHTPSRQDAEQLAGTAFDQVLADVRDEDVSDVFLRPRLVGVVGRAGTQGPRPAERITDVYLGLPASWQAVLWYLDVEGLDLEQAARLLGLSSGATTGLHLEARAGLRAAYRQARLEIPATAACEDCAADLGAFADGALPAQRAQGVRAHLDDCPRCAADYLYLQDTRAGLRSWVLPVLAGVPLWGTGAEELVDLVRSAGDRSATNSPGARGADVAGGALAAVLVARRGRKVLLDAGVLAAAAVLAGAVVTGTGGLGIGTPQATDDGSGAAADTAAPVTPSPTARTSTAPSAMSDGGTVLARGTGAAAPGGSSPGLSLPTPEPSPGALTESAAEERSADHLRAPITAAGHTSTGTRNRSGTESSADRTSTETSPAEKSTSSDSRGRGSTDGGTTTEDTDETGDASMPGDATRGETTTRGSSGGSGDGDSNPSTVPNQRGAQERASVDEEPVVEQSIATRAPAETQAPDETRAPEETQPPPTPGGAQAPVPPAGTPGATPSLPAAVDPPPPV